MKFSIITLFLGQTRNRFLIYQEANDVVDRLRRAGQARGCDGVELRYPADFEDLATLKAALADNGLGVSAINFASVRNEKWLRGSWTATDPTVRREVVDEMRRAMDVAAELGIDRITNCPLNDGYDYHFEMDYLDAFDAAAESYAAAADHNPAIKLCIEYKISEPRMRCQLGTAGQTAAFCQYVDRDNLGVTLDSGHALFANENIAMEAAMLARTKRLFYVHLNDNDGRADWDLIPGSIHFWPFVELFYTLRKIGYDDWYAFDIVPKEHDPVPVFETAVTMSRKFDDIAARIDKDRMEDLLRRRDPSATMAYLSELV